MIRTFLALSLLPFLGTPAVAGLADDFNQQNKDEAERERTCHIMKEKVTFGSIGAAPLGDGPKDTTNTVGYYISDGSDGTTKNGLWSVQGNHKWCKFDFVGVLGRIETKQNFLGVKYQEQWVIEGNNLIRYNKYLKTGEVARHVTKPFPVIGKNSNTERLNTHCKTYANQHVPRSQHASEIKRCHDNLGAAYIIR